MALPKRPTTSPRRTSRALGATVALTGLFFSQAGVLDASAPITAQEQDPATSTAPVAADAPRPDTSIPDDAPTDADVSRTGLEGDDAEKIARIERVIRLNREELEKQRAQIDDGPDSEYHRAEREFNELDARFEETRKAQQAAIDAGQDDRAEALRDELDELDRRRQLARDRFELEVRGRKAANEQVEILEKTIASDERVLRRLLGEEPPEADAPASPVPDASTAAPPADATATPPIPAPATTALETAPDADNAPSPTIPGLPAPRPAGGARPSPEPPESEEVVRAQQQVDAKAAAAAQAERRSQSLDERLTLVDRNIASIREQLRNAQLKSDNARQTRDLLAEEFRDRSFAGAPQDELRLLGDRIREAEATVRQATAEVRDRTSRLEVLVDERGAIIDVREAVALETAAARQELESARDALKEASNPFSPRNLSRWALTRGPGILAILLVAALLVWVINRFGHRVAAVIAERGTRGSQAEREDRARTLVSVFQNAASAVIVIGAAIMALDQAGVPIAPILGGAAVLGLAISFGAQNLVSDFFYGFMILLENQYKLNDVVKINDHSGQVERITLRMTALRDLEGNLHFIPNGQIKAVVNQTHGWSRALFDINVAYKENVDRVMDVILEVGKDLRNDPRFRPLILEDPTMLGVDGFADSAVVIKFFIKTRPLQQWTVKRELLRRLKNTFDERGIEIPFPHRTVYHRTDSRGFDRLTIEAERSHGDGDGFSH